MSKTRTYRDLLTQSLCDPVQAKHYLRAVLEDYPEGFLKALGNVARANQMSKVAKSAGIQRESLYRSLSDNGNPTWDTLAGIAAAVGLKFTVLTLDEDPFSSGAIEKTLPATLSQTSNFADQTICVFSEKVTPVRADAYKMQPESFGCLGIEIPSLVQQVPPVWFTGENNGHH